MQIPIPINKLISTHNKFGRNLYHYVPKIKLVSNLQHYNVMYFQTKQ